MVVAPDNLYGIDKQIKRVQDYLNDKIADIWAGNICVYGRAIETERDGVKVLENWTENNDYKQIFVNDRYDAVIGFKVNEREINENRLKASLDIIFTVNVKEVLGVFDYLDEKVLMDAYKIVNGCGLIENVSAVKVGIDNVFTGYDTEKIKHRDMSPYHVFSFTTAIEYFESVC